MKLSKKDTVIWTAFFIVSLATASILVSFITSYEKSEAEFQKLLVSSERDESR